MERAEGCTVHVALEAWKRLQNIRCPCECKTTSRRWRLRAVAAASLGGKSGRGGARGSCERKSCARAGRLVRGEWDGAGSASSWGAGEAPRVRVKEVMLRRERGGGAETTAREPAGWCAAADTEA